MQFRTKARAVDLLGKGQIADLPTAITELWKNGYDAYADNLTAEVYLPGYKGLNKPLFIITDDGKGMSRQDVLAKWLVLGTDSKSRATLEEEASIDTLWKSPRIKAGEKGIGRLSIAFLGSPMLMLTKKIGYPLEALYIDWRLLENFNLFLDDVNIPVASIEHLIEFEDIFRSLKQAFLQNLDATTDRDGNGIWEDSQLKLRSDILESTNNATLPTFFDAEILHTFHDSDAHGTKFLIFEPIDQIIELTQKDEDLTEDRTFVLSSLSGFTNTFKHPIPKVSTRIPIHEKDGNDWDFLTSQGNFFTDKDYDLADILIDGNFDGNGSFTGSIRIFGESIDYTFTNPRKKDSRNVYGEVPIRLGYSQGNEVESGLEDETFDRIKQKVTNYGGLYIYRDDFRVLPYGRPNVDFLRFEERRSKRASTAYFSYRRMFGYLDLRRDENPKLKDKSSREGLINNAPYRAFESDLIAFFKDLAKQYFSDNATESIFLDKKEKLKRESEAIKKDQARAIKEKKEFSRLLNDYPSRLDKYQKEYQDVIDELDRQSQDPHVSYIDIENLLDKKNALDISYKDLLPKIPKRYKPTDTQLDRLDKYEAKLITFNETVLKNSAPILLRVQEKLEVKELKVNLEKDNQRYKSALERLIQTNRDILKERFDYLIRDFATRSKHILDELSYGSTTTVNSIGNNEDAIKASETIAKTYEFLRSQIEGELVPLVDHVKVLTFDIDEELVQGAYKAEYEAIKFQWEQTKETAQLGIAVEIIDHEFNQLYAKINQSISSLSSVEEVVHNRQFELLKRNFRQLEDKYALLSPLYRIAGVMPRDINGVEMFDYLKDFFQGRLEGTDISFNATEEFKNLTLNIKEPIIFTSLINIVNNAFYWIRNSKAKEIRLDYYRKSEEILIMNSGERIPEHKLEKIFDLFYSNRPNGRGIGLYLSKQSLNENYFDLLATNDKAYNQLNGACFVIQPLNSYDLP